MKIDSASQRYAFLALLAAALFGASTPMAKQLLGAVDATLLAGLLYLGSGLGLLFLWFVAGRGRYGALPAGRDWLWLLGSVMAGGIAAPVLLMHGLLGTPAGSASLMLNLESVLTAAVARFAFREAVGARIWTAAGVMLIAAGILGYDPTAPYGVSGSAALIVAACLMWALDNNLTRRVSGSDAVFLALFKGLVAGACTIALAWSIGASAPPAYSLAGALLVGFAGYGLSLVLFIVALRHLGSARTGAHFSTAPFFGGAIAVLFFGEPLSAQVLVAVLVMAVATWLVLSETHEHEHTHDPLEHQHMHVHDDHHRHDHHGGEGPEPHSHPHRQGRLTHAHKHLPDLHHRHPH